VDLRLLRLTDTPYVLRRTYARWRVPHLARAAARTETAPALVHTSIAEWNEAFVFEVLFPAATTTSAPDGGAAEAAAPAPTPGVAALPATAVELGVCELVVEVWLVRVAPPRTWADWAAR
jgi:hypothetical protein